MIIRNKFNGYSGDGRRLYPGGGGGQAPPSTQNVTQTTIPEYAQPYVERMLGKAEAFTQTPYQAYRGERQAPFSDLQRQYLAAADVLGPTQQIGEASALASDVGARAGQMGYGAQYFGNQYRAPQAYRPGQFGVRDVRAQQIYTPQMRAAQTGFAPDLEMYQMGPAERVGVSSLLAPGLAEAYMSPYQQAVTDIEKREATRSSDILRSQQRAQAAQQGAFGGSRQAIVEAERQRNLATQLGDIQARGGQAAYDRATQQFNAEQQARLQAQLANQQAALASGQANLQAALGVQQLGTQTGLQTALANLSNQQQAQVQNLAANLQAQGMSSDQALRAALANQSAYQQAQTAAEQSRQFGYGQGMTAQQLAAQYGLAGQQATEQSRQFGATYGMDALRQQLAAAQQLGGLGQTEFAQQQQAMEAMRQAGGMQQAMRQQQLDQAYQDFLTQRGYPQQQLAFMSDILRGVPLSQQTQLQYQAPPSLTAQLGGLGLGAYGLSQLTRGAKQGGLMSSGLSDLAVEQLSRG